MLDSISNPFHAMGHDLAISASIGISLFPDDSIDAEVLMQQADSSIYAAKREGKNRVMHNTADIGFQVHERPTLECLLRGAVARDEIGLHYQPEFDLNDHRPVRFEALARWTHPTNGVIPPFKFIPIADESGIIVAMGAYILEQAWRARYANGTADEIRQQTTGRVTPCVAILGTSGTSVETSRRLKELNPAIRCISLQPDSPFHGIEGAKYMATSIIPRIYDPRIADAELSIETEAAYTMAKGVAGEEGLLIGVFAAAALVGAMQVAKDAYAGSVVVTIFPDSGDKYLSEHFWDETS